MDELTQFLMRDNSSVASIDPDKLKLMAKQAAARYLAEGIALTDSVAKLATDENGIQNEHIRRICEFANQEVNARLFEREVSEQKLAGQQASGVVYPQFVLADPDEVIKRLNDGTKVASVQQLSDYDLPPSALFADDGDALLERAFTKTAMEGSGKPEFSHPINQKGIEVEPGQALSGELTSEAPTPEIVGSSLGEEHSILSTTQSRREHFPNPPTNPPELQKESSIPFANPFSGLFQLRNEIHDYREALNAQHGLMDLRAREAWDDFYGHVKQAMLSKHASFGDISNVCFQVANGDDRVHQATVKVLAEKLMMEKAASPAELGEDLEKTAAATRQPNPDSPLVQSYGAALTLMTERQKLAGVVHQLDEGLKEIDEFVRTRLVPASA